MSNGQSTLIVDIRPGDRLSIAGQEVSIELLKKSGQLARLRVTAPIETKIDKYPATAGIGVVASMA